MKKFKVLLPFLLVLSFWGQNISVYAQDLPCTVYGDTVEVNLYNPHTYREGDKLMYQVEVRLKRVDLWEQTRANRYSTELEGITLGFLWYDMCDPSDAIWKNFVGTGIENWGVKWEWAKGSDGEAPVDLDGLGYYGNMEVNITDVGLDCDISQRQRIGIVQITNPDIPMDFFDNTTYLSFATITWELQPTATGKVGIRFDYIYNTTGTCISDAAAVNTKESGLLILFTGSGIVDLGGIEPPVFAEDMDTISCGRDFPWSWDYALNSENTPTGADTCIWFVKDVSLPIVAVDSGSKVTIEWPAAGDYTICAYSKNTGSGAVSDTIYQTVHIKNMPTADLDSITYACPSSSTMTVAYTNLNPSGTVTAWLNELKVQIVSVGGSASMSAAPNKVYYLALAYEGCKDTLKTETRTGTPSVDVNRDLTACGDTINLWVNSFVGDLHWLKEDRTTPLLGEQPLVYSGVGQTVKDYWVYADISNNGHFCTSDTFPVTVHFRTKPTVDVGMNGMFTSCDANSGKLFYSNLSVQATTHWLRQDYTVASAANENPFAVTKTNTTDYYYLAIEDASCGDTIPVSITFGTRPTADVALLQTACDPDYGNLKYNSISAGTAKWYDHNYSNPSTDNPYAVIATQTGMSDTYHLIVTDGSCADTLDVDIEFDSRPVVSVTDPLTSCDNQLTLSATCSDNSAALKWLDNTKATLTSTTVSTAGTYYVYAAGGAGCNSDTMAVTVELNTRPVVTVTSPLTSCDNQLTLSATCSDNSATLKWLASDRMTALPSTIITASGTYYVYADGGTGCMSDTMAVTVELGTKPVVSVTDPLTSCDNQLTLSATCSDNSAALKWLDNTKVALTSTTVTTGGTYYVYADGGTGCMSDTMAVTVELGTKPVVSVTDPLTNCDNQLTLSATCSDNSATLKWLDNNKSALASTTVTTGGTYYVYADGGTGCMSDTMAVTVELGTQPVVSVTDPLTSCDNQVTLSATCSDNSATLKWLKNDYSALTSTTVTTGGTYYVYADGGTGCTSDTMAVTVELNTRPVLTVTSPLTSCDNQLTLSATCSDNSATLKWLDNNKVALTSTTVTTGGTYYVYADGGTGCSSDTMAVTVELGTQPIVSVTDPLTSCDNQITLDATCSDNSATLRWLDNTKATLTSTTVSTAGTYYVYADGIQAGCTSDTIAVTVELNTRPVVTVTSPLTSCDNQLTLSAICSDNSATLKWLKDDYSALTSTTVSDGGTYYVYAAGTQSGCASDTMAVTVEINTRPVVTVTSPLTSCESRLNLNAICSDNSATLKWLKNDYSALSSITVSDAGTYYVYADGGTGCSSDTMAVTVELGTKPVVSVTDPLTSCDNQLTLSATCSDNSATLKWLKNDYSALSSVTVSGAGTYYVYADGTQSGCMSDTMAVTVELGTKPVVSVTDPLTSCDNQLTLSATCSDNSATLKWLDNTKVALTSTTVSIAGTYYVYAAGTQAGCSSDTMAVTVEFGTKPVVSVTDPLTSCDNQLTLSATCSDNSAALKWLDNNKSALASTTVTTGGTYYVYADGGTGCMSDTMAVTVELGTKPVVSVTDPLTSCDNQVTLTANCSDNSATLKWLDNNKSALASTTVTTGGTYYVYADGGTGCMSDTMAVTVELGTKPVVSVTDPLTSCDNQVTLTANCSDNSATLKWLDNTKSALASTTVTTGGTYYVYADGGTGCMSDTMAVTVELGTRPEVTVADPLTSCDNQVTLSATCSDNSATLKWLDNNKSALASTTVTTGGTYYVYADGGTACTSDTIAVTVELNTRPIVTVTSPLTSCDNQVTLSATCSDNSATLKWLKNDYSALASTTVSDGGTYYVYAAGGAGCESDTLPVAVQLNTRPVVTVEDTLTSCENSLILTATCSDNSATLKWLDSDKATALTSMTVSATGTYYVYATSTQAGCASDTMTVHVQFDTKPLITVSDPQTTCGNSLTLSASCSDNSATLKWLAGDKATALTSTIVSTAGTYYVYAAGTQAGCTSDTVAVNVQLGTKPTLTLQPQYTACGSDVMVAYSGLTDPAAVVTWLDRDGSTVLGSANPFTITNATDGTYYVSVVGAGCGDTLPVVVRPHTDPELTVNATGFSSCTQDVALSLNSLSDLTATVYWLTTQKQLLGTGDPLVITEPTAANGIHYVVAVGSTCQSDTVPFNVSTNTEPMIAVEPLFTSCNTSVTLRLNSLSDAGATVKWLAGDKSTVVATGNPAVATIPANGTYYVYAEGASAGCNSDTLEFEVKVNTEPVITLNPDGYASCTDLVTLQLLALSDWSARIEWLNAAGDLVAVGNPGIVNDAVAGQYKVRVTGQGCANPVEKTFNVRTGEAGLTLAIRPVWDNCDVNVTVSLSSLSDWGAVVKWFDGDGNLFAVGNPAVVFNAQPGNYGVMAQEPMNGCKSDTAHFTITECNVADGILAEAEPDTICLGNVSQLTVTSLDTAFVPLTYAWSPSAGLDATNTEDPVFTPTAAGTFDFYVEVTGLRYGVPTVYKDTVTVFVRNAVAPQLDALAAIYCNNEKLVAVDTGAERSVSYQWYVNGTAISGATDSVYTWTTAPSQDTVSVVGIAANGCRSAEASVILDIASPIVLTTVPSDGDVTTVAMGSSVAGGSVSASGGTSGYTYHWTLPAAAVLDMSNTAYASFIAQDIAYDFSVYVTDARGCVSDTARWHVDVNGWDTLCMKMGSVYGNAVCTNGAAVLRAQICDGVNCNGTPGCVSGSGGPYIYEWYTANSLIPVRTTTTAQTWDEWIVTPSAPEKYYVKVRDLGATPVTVALDSVNLTIQPSLAPVADAGADQSIMQGAYTVLVGSGSGGTVPYRWHWMPANGLVNGEDTLQYPQTVTLNDTKEYRLCVVDDASCVSLPDTVTVTVSPTGWKIVIVPEKDTICGDVTRLVTVRKATGAWTAGETIDWFLDPATTTGVVYNARKDSLWFTPAGPGEYSFIAQVTDGSKTAALRSDIVVKSGNAPHFTLVATQTMCGQDTVKVVYAPGSVLADGFKWNVAGVEIDTTLPYFILPNPGTVMNYPVSVSAYVTGCASNTESMNITVQPSPELTAVLTDSCGQAVIEVSGSGATQNYTWNINPSASAVTEQNVLNAAKCTISATGAYQVEVTATNGMCTVSRTLSGEVHARPVLGNWVTAPNSLYFVPATLTAQVNATGGTPYEPGSYYKYHWFSGSTAAGDGMPKDTVEKIGIYNYSLTTGANYTIRVVAQDSNSCYSDTLVQATGVSSGRIDVTLTSVYGDGVCQDGAALLKATVSGAIVPCNFRWYKGNSTVAIDSVIGTNDLQVMKWVSASDAGEYRVIVTDAMPYEGTDTVKLTVSTTLTAPVADAGPDMTIQSNTSTALLGTVTTTSVAPYEWHWSPADKLATLADTAYQYPQTAQLTSDQRYQLFVVDAQSCVSEPDSVTVTVDDVNGLCITAVPAVDTICYNNTLLWKAMDVCGTLDGTEAYAWSGTDATLLNSLTRDTARFIPLSTSDAGWYEYAVKVERNGLSAAARVRVNLLDQNAPVLDLEGGWNCLSDTVRVVNTGETAMQYNWEWDGIPVVSADTFFAIASTGKHILKVYATAANGCLSDEIELPVNVGQLPTVKIVEPYIVAYRDSIFDLHLDQSDAVWAGGAGQFNIAWEPTNRISGSTTGVSIQSIPMSGDTIYTVQVADTANLACVGMDTVNAYIIPDSVAIDIDKDTITGNILLRWDHTQPGLVYADSVRIMGVKWDGYAVATQYTPRAMSALDLDKYMVNIANDTLEFFYMNASRYIAEAGRSYYSHSSDTVGYFKQWLLVASGNTKGFRYNFITYPFDMTKKGIINTIDLGKFIGSYSDGMNKGKYMVNSIAKFEFSLQNWTQRQTYIAANDDKSSLTAGWVGQTFDLELGAVYRVVMTSDAKDTELLLYGKLPSRFVYNLQTATTTETGFNYMAYPLSLANLRYLTELGDRVNDINSVALHTFYISQDWSQRVTWLGNWVGSVNVKGYAWLPIRIVVNTTGIFDK